MGLLEKQLGLLPVTSNQQMLAQALKSRSKSPMSLKPVTPQGLLDNAALATSPVPVLGDVLGLGADAYRFATDESSRTPMNYGLAALGLIPFVPPLVSAGLGKFAQSQGKTLANLPTGPARNQAGAIVYHGSPHKFDAFDSSKIGTGEGAQAYGHGLYFAENPEVAKTYKNTNNYNSPQFSRMSLDEKLEFLSKEKNPTLYKVDLPDEAIAKMLDWDKPLSQQSEILKNSLKKFNDDYGLFDTKTGQDLLQKNPTGKQIYQYLEDITAQTSAEGVKRNVSQDISQLLGKYNAPGIRYLDGGSRDAGSGTSNYVVFPGNEGLLKILERQ